MHPGVDIAAEHTKKRKGREQDSVAVDSKEERRGKVEPGKHKDVSRGESSRQHKDGEGRDRERGSERDRRGRNRGVEKGGSGAERVTNKDKENTEWHIQDELRNPELEKELEKRIRRRDGGIGDKDKRHEDGRESGDARYKESDDKRLSSSDDRRRSGNYRDERHRDRRHSRDKYREDLDRDHRHRDDRHCDERSSSNHASDRHHSEHIKEDKFTERHQKKSKLQHSDNDGGPYVEDHRIESKDNRGRKRPSDENGDHRDLRLRGRKQPCGDVEKSVSSRCSSKQGDSTRRESSSQEKLCASAASKVDHGSTSGVSKRDSESRSWEKTKPKDHMSSGGSVRETAADPKYDKKPGSDGRSSPINVTEKSSSTSDWQDTRHNLDIEDTRQIDNSLKDERGGFTMNYSVCVDSLSITGMLNNEHIPVGSSSLSRAGHFSDSSPRCFSPQAHFRPRFDRLSDFGSFEDNKRYQTGNRKATSSYKNGDYSTGRSQGNAWRSPSPLPPVTNGFIPFQHGPPPSPFHSSLCQFPAPSLFGIRQSLQMNPTRVSYPGHEAADRFAGHPFGWRDSGDVTFSQLQGWGRDGNAEEPRVNGWTEWDQNRHPMGIGEGWERNSGMWKGENTLPPRQEHEYTSGALVDDPLVGKSGHGSQAEEAQMVFVPDETEAKPSDAPPVKHADGTPRKGPSKTRSDASAHIICTYLLKLDVSVGLTGPELYKQCMALLGTRNAHGEKCDSKHGCPQHVKEDTEAAAAAKCSKYTSSFPKTTDAVFQKAMSFYKKQKEATRVKFPVSCVSSKEERNLPAEASNAEEVEGTVCPKNLPEFSSGETVKAPAHQASEETSEANATQPEEDGSTITAKEEQSCVIYDGTVFVECGYRECEAVVPECRVTVNRIHNFPESTH